MRKRYTLQNENTGSDGKILCTEDSLYYVTRKYDGTRTYYYLTEFSFSDKTERMVTELPDIWSAEALAYYKNKLFMLLTTSIEESYYGYVLYYVDLLSDDSKYHAPCQSEIYVWRGSTIKEYGSGWFFVPKKTDYPIEKFDFETMTLSVVAKDCGYSEHNSGGFLGCGQGWWSRYVNEIYKIGQWLYFRQGENGSIVRVSLFQPMEVKILPVRVMGEDL